MRKCLYLCAKQREGENVYVNREREVELVINI